LNVAGRYKDVIKIIKIILTAVHVSLWSNSTICLTDLPPFKMVSVTENRNVMEWAYILYILPMNGWHLNCRIIWRSAMHIFTYDLYSYCYLVIYKERCDPNLVVITDAWFLIQLFFKWNSSEVWRLYVVIWRASKPNPSLVSYLVLILD
jgi:hypothetical protein